MLIKNNPRFIGSVLILIGTIIGAGILALPIVCAGMGFIRATLTMICISILMLFTGLLTLEVNLAFPTSRNHLGTMAEATLGKFGKIISWIVTLLLLYTLTSAYISGNSAFLEYNLEKYTTIHIPEYVSKFLVTLVLGSIVCTSTSLVDLFNRSFLGIKGVLLIAALILMMPQVDFIQIATTGSNAYIIGSLPILIASFGFHPTIPSITNYIGIKPNSLVKIVILGALIPLVIYILWIFAVTGIVPLDGKLGFISFAKNPDAANSMLASIAAITQNKWLIFCLNGFSYIAMTTSFLGVTLGLFDFLADGFKKANSPLERLETGLMTFLPPLIFTIIFPKGFVYALGYAAFFAAILVIIMPALMAYQLRKSQALRSPLKIPGGTFSLILVVLCGVAIMVIETLLNCNLLPIL